MELLNLSDASKGLLPISPLPLAIYPLPEQKSDGSNLNAEFSQ